MKKTNKYAKKLKEARAAAGLTQQQLSDITGIKRVMIAQYETAYTIPYVNKYDKLITACQKIIKKSAKDKPKK